jgi:protoheme IX farnesyltransferase
MKILSLARYAKVLAGATFLLIVAGGLVTSTGSGLSVPDWPTSFGYNMFALPFHRWAEEGVRFEHTHRVIASLVGLATLVLAGGLFAREPRPWLRGLGVVAALAVITQGVLGGLTVRYKLPVPVSTAHACLAQSFFALTVAIATFLSPRWQYEHGMPGAPGLRRAHRLAVMTAGFVFLQLAIGAYMRHTGAGLAISTFPLAWGMWIPPLQSRTVQVAFAHRVGALLVSIHVVLLAVRILRKHRAEPRLVRPALLLLALLALQISLGAATVLSDKAVLPTTAHVAVGATIFATAVAIALRTHRPATLAERAPLHAAARAGPSRLADYAALTKPRVTSLVLVTMLVGFAFGSDGATPPSALLAAVAGTALLAAGAAALNQFFEREHDRSMRRTANRPLPAGRIRPWEALLFGAALAAGGLACLALRVNALTAAIGAATFAAYVFLYTPLKRMTPLCTAVGAVPGALPPLMGFAAARNALPLEAWALFAILFVWQLPHFLAISWMYREDYARAGYAMHAVRDPDGVSTSRRIAVYCLALLVVSLAPSFLHMSGPVYFYGALVLGVSHLALGIAVAALRSRPSARGLFLGSIVYLPILLGLLTLDKR